VHALGARAVATFHAPDAADLLAHLGVAVILDAARPRNRRVQRLLGAQHDAAGAADGDLGVVAGEALGLDFARPGDREGLVDDAAADRRLERARARQPQRAGLEIVDAHRRPARRRDPQVAGVEPGGRQLHRTRQFDRVERAIAHGDPGREAGARVPEERAPPPPRLATADPQHAVLHPCADARLQARRRLDDDLLARRRHERDVEAARQVDALEGRHRAVVGDDVAAGPAASRQREPRGRRGDQHTTEDQERQGGAAHGRAFA